MGILSKQQLRMPLTVVEESINHITFIWRAITMEAAYLFRIRLFI